MRPFLMPLLAFAGLAAAVSQARPASAMQPRPVANVSSVQLAGYYDDWRWREREAWRAEQWRRHEAWREWRHEHWAARRYGYDPY